MTRRALLLSAFLEETGWADAENRPLAADFSSRRFARLRRGSPSPQSAVLMDNDKDETIAGFIAMDEALRGHSISAPIIYAADPANGFILMEDFGDANFGRMIDAGQNGGALALRSLELLIHLHETADDVHLANFHGPLFDAAYFGRQVGLFLENYFVLIKGRRASESEATGFASAWHQTLREIEPLPRTLVLRDFMADNLMDLPSREGWRSIGVLDFQDGGIGPMAYDLASLCEKVRRDSIGLSLDDAVDIYVKKARHRTSADELKRACRILAAQRHTRILGILAQRMLKSGETDKFAFVPRIWRYLRELFEAPEMEGVLSWMKKLEFVD